MENSKRNLALDVFRGFTISGMILVNTPGSWKYVYSPLRHAEWHGCTPTDLVFPFFLFVMGVSMFFSFSKLNNNLNKKILVKVFRRSILIFTIGMFLNSFPQWSTDYSQLRIMGVLQRIAIAYAISSVLVLSLKLKPLIICSAILLMIHWAGLYFLGGDEPYSLEQNATLFIDKTILGENHLYRGFGIPFDPEGLFSSISAVVSVIIGYVVGKLIKKVDRNKLIRQLLVIGSSLVCVGWIWNLILPLNKTLWTGSYVLYTGGLAILILSLLIWIIDIKELKKWASFFVVFGMNPLFIYAFSILWVKIMIYLVKINIESNATITGYQAIYQ
jgi:predicted acyltransferase